MPLIKNNHGFTFTEIMITIAIMGIIFASGGVAVAKLEHSVAARTSDREVLHVLSSAARRARHGAEGTNWGVYLPYDFETRQATELVVFSGTSYASRNTALDVVYPISDSIAFTTVDFSGAGPDTGNDREIVFTVLSGETSNYGSVMLTWYGETKTISIDADGHLLSQ